MQHGGPEHGHAEHKDTHDGDAEHGGALHGDAQHSRWFRPNKLGRAFDNEAGRSERRHLGWKR